MVKYASILALLILAMSAVVGCSGGTPTAAEPVDIALVATDIAYDTTQIDGVAGRPLRVTLENAGALEHDFTIDEIPLSGAPKVEQAVVSAEHEMGHTAEEAAVHVAAAAGATGVVEFTPTSPGEYAFYCTVSGHREAGMEGTVVVSAP